MFKKIIQFALRNTAIGVLKKYKPIIIVITGSVGKTSAKEAIYALVRRAYRTYRTQRNENNEIGVPITVLGCESPGRNIFKWLAVVGRAFKLLLAKDEFYPEALVLEFGADRPGDIHYLTSFIKPHISVVTAIGEIPAHVEFFSGPKAVAKEKAHVVRALNAQGFALLNFDDDVVLDMKRETDAHTITFGFGRGADVRAVSLKYKRFANGGIGMAFVIEHNGKPMRLELPGVLGKQQTYSVLAAYAAGVVLKMKQEDIKSALGGFEAIPGRMKMLEGIKKTWIIDDTYNASPMAVHAALDVLGEINAKRKVVVLGDMREIGKYAFEAHQAIGDRAARVADILICIGDVAKVISEEATAKGLDSNNVFWFDIDALREAAKTVQGILKEGDVVLVKASRAVHLERIVKEIMAHPEHADSLLVH